MNARPIATLSLMLVLGPAPASAFDPFSRSLPEVEEGNRQYDVQHFEDALGLYEKAEEQLEREPRIHFNRGSTLFKLGRTKEARESFMRAMGTEDPALKKDLYYNIGNTFLSEKAWADAMTYYRRSLELDSGFDDARFNLELALRALQQQQENKTGQQQTQKQRDEQRDQQQKDEQKQDPQKQDQPQDQQNQDQKPDQQQDQQRPDQNQPDQQKPDQQQSDQEKQPEQKPDQKPDQQQSDSQSADQQKPNPQQPEQQPPDQQQPEQQSADSQPEPKPDDAQQPDAQPADQQKQDQKAEPRNVKQPQQADPKRLSQRQAQELLDALRDNETPFQMHRFLLPEYKRKDRTVDKDW